MNRDNIGPGNANSQLGNGPRRPRRTAKPPDIPALIEKQLSRKIKEPTPKTNGQTRKKKGSRQTYLQAYTKRTLYLVAAGNKQAARIYRKLEAYKRCWYTIL